MCYCVITASAYTSAGPLRLKQNGVYTLVITSGCTGCPLRHTRHIGSGAELLFLSLIHDQRLVRIVQQQNALACFKQGQDLLATE